MRWLLALAVLLAALVPVARAQTTDPAPSPGTLQPYEAAVPPGSFMGMVVRDPYYEWQTNTLEPDGTNKAFFETMGANLQAAGVRWVRIELFAEEWGTATTPKGQVAAEKYSYFINTVAPKYGLKVIGLLATPLVRWQAGADQGLYLNPELLEARTDDPPGASPGCVGDPVAYPFGCATNPYMRIWLNNAFTVATAFPYDAATGAGIAAFEVLNEPNRYINGGGKGLRPDAVATMMTKFYRIYRERCAAGAIGGNCSEVKIILGGLHPGRCDDCNMATDRQYLEAIYKSGPFQSYRASAGRYPLDGVAYHPYPLEMRAGLVPEPTGTLDIGRVTERVIGVRRVMLANGDVANKIWITEVGDRGAPADADNQARQAQFFKAMLWTLWRQRAYIETVLWFKYEDFAVPTLASDYGPENWGVVRLMPRPTSQVCPQRDLPRTCEYEENGTVQVAKQILADYTAMSTTGAGLETYRSLLPVIDRSP